MASLGPLEAFWGPLGSLLGPPLGGPLGAFSRFWKEIWIKASFCSAHFFSEGRLGAVLGSFFDFFEAILDLILRGFK